MFDFGIIGAGMVSNLHSQWIKDEGRGNIIAVCDVNEDAALKLANSVGAKKVFCDYKEFLKENLDGVIIATPPFTHKEIFLEAVKNNNNILLEKPMCVNYEELLEMENAFMKNPHLKIMDCSARHSRLQPKFKFVKELIDSKELGDIYYINHISYGRQNRSGIEYNTSSKWFLNKKLALAGPLADWGMYDLAFDLGVVDIKELPSVISSKLMGHLDNIDYGDCIYDTEEHFITDMEFTNGFRYHYERSSNINNKKMNETKIFGTKGGLKFSFYSWDNPVIEYFFVDDNKKAQSKELTVNMENHRSDGAELISHFIDYVQGKTQPILPFDNAILNMKIIFEILEGNDEK